MSMQKKADISFAVLKQNKPLIEEQMVADAANILNAQNIVKLAEEESKTDKTRISRLS